MQRGEEETLETMKHATMATARMRFLFVAAKLMRFQLLRHWSHSGRTGIGYSGQYREQGVMNRQMSRLRAITTPRAGIGPVIAVALK